MEVLAVGHAVEPVGRRSRRRRVRFGGSDATDTQKHWAPKWRKLFANGDSEPDDFTDFDRTVRGMLNRVSAQNATRLLPLEPCLRGGEFAAGDCPFWWAARFSAHMLGSYLQVIHTNRYARGLATRSADNVLPEYIEAVAPLLSQSSRLVSALLAWFARLLRWQELSWPTARLVILASRESRSKEELPPSALGRLQPEVLRGRVLSFLRPAPCLAVESLRDGALAAFAWAGSESDERDATAVLAHLILFGPAELWPRFLTFGIALAEAALLAAGLCEAPVYLAASLLTTVAQRIQLRILAPGAEEELERHLREDMGPLLRLEVLLAEAMGRQKEAQSISPFVLHRAEVALEHLRRVQESCSRARASLTVLSASRK